MFIIKILQASALYLPEILVCQLDLGHMCGLCFSAITIMNNTRDIQTAVCWFSHLNCRIWLKPWLWGETTSWMSAPLPMEWSLLCLKRGSGVLEPGWKLTGRPFMPLNPGESSSIIQLYQFGKKSNFTCSLSFYLLYIKKQHPLNTFVWFFSLLLEGQK